MERRKFMIGVGSLAAGSAAAMGTGAFTSVTASRNVDVSVASDASAYLALEGVDDSVSGNEEYVTSDGSSGSLSIDLTNSDVDGSGVNPDALTQINYLFTIQNQGTQTVDVSVSKSDEDGNEDAVTFYSTADASTDPYSSSNRIDGSGNSVSLGTGEEVYVSIQVDTRNTNLSDGDTLLDSVTINATA